MQIVRVIPFIKLQNASSLSCFSRLKKIKKICYFFSFFPQRKVICDVSSEAVFCGSLIYLKYLRIIVLL